MFAVHMQANGLSVIMVANATTMAYSMDMYATHTSESYDSDDVSESTAMTELT